MNKPSKILDDWTKLQIIHKRRILNFEWLFTRNYIIEISDGYFYLNVEYDTVEQEIYKYYNDKLKVELNITDSEQEIKKFITDLHIYNEVKDIGHTLIGKLAEKKGVSSKNVLEEVGHNFD